MTMEKVKYLTPKDRKAVREFCEFLGHGTPYFEDFHDQFEPIIYCSACGKRINEEKIYS